MFARKPKAVTDTIQLKSKDLNKFYELLVLLKALGVATRTTATYANFEESMDIKNLDSVFKAFVYKLGHICDSDRGGNTVTAFAVLKEDGGLVHYRFASNKRSQTQLEHTKSYIQKMLKKFQKIPENLKIQEFDATSLLSNVIIFNRPRLTFYIRQIKAQASSCMSLCANDIFKRDKEVYNTFQEIIKHANFDTSSATPNEEFANNCINLIELLRNLRQSRVDTVMCERARKGRLMLGVPSSECWSDLQHMISRTLAYRYSVMFIFAAKCLWPALFKRFQISFFQSSQKIKRPCPKKSQTAQAIVQRMTTDHHTRKTFQEFVRDLQLFQLDELIQQECQKKTFRPIVHAEVLLLDELEKKGLLKSHHFFNSCMYIGSSKPTCRLCDYYFESHDSKVGRRTTHATLYLNWRFPDVLQAQGRKGEEKRKVMIDKVRNMVRNDAFEVVMRKTPSRYRKQDSFTVSVTVPTSLRFTGSGENFGDEAAPTIAQIGLS